MSRGNVDEPLRARFAAVEAAAAKKGLKVIAASNPDGLGWRYDYGPLRPRRARAETPAEPRRISRGVTAKPDQGELL